MIKETSYYQYFCAWALKKKDNLAFHYVHGDIIQNCTNNRTENCAVNCTEMTENHPGFTKAFNTVPHGTLIEKMMLYGLDEQRVKYIENWTTGWEYWMVISGAKSSWRPLTSSVLQSCLTHSWMMGQIILSVSLQMTQYWYKWLIGPTRGSCCHSEGPGQTRELGDRNFVELHKEKCKVLHLGRNNSRHPYTPSEDWQEISFCRKGSGSLSGHQVEHKLDVPLPQRKPTVSFAEFGGVPPTVWGWWSLPSTRHL